MIVRGVIEIKTEKGVYKRPEVVEYQKYETYYDKED